MILASELRIGNVFKGIGGIQTVLSLEENTDRGMCNYSSDEHRLMYSHLILCHQNGNQYKPWEIEPIPLSEEILLKCGFELSGSVQKIGYFRLIYEDGGKLFFYSHPMLKIELKYLHQLQNLYFASTGNELNTSQL